MKLPTEYETEFWDRVDKTDINSCWNWKSTKNWKGYGMYSIGGNHYRAHRIAYETKNGAIKNKLHVLHSCDNPACCNPKHLKLGTNKDNIQDAARKGRMTRGEKQKSSKLKEIDVINIRKEFDISKVSSRHLAIKYNVCHSTILNIINGKKWKYLLEVNRNV